MFGPRIGLIFLAALATATQAPAQHHDSHHTQRSASAVEEEVRAVHARMQRAAEQRDAAALFEHVLESSTPTIIEDGSLVATHAAALERTGRDLRGLARLSYVYTRQSVTAVGPETALWVGDGAASAELSDGRQLTAPFAETIVFVKRGGAWKVLHAHRSSPNQ